MVSTAYNAALYGLQAASLQLRVSANNIANSDTDGYQKQQVTTQAGTYGVEVKVEKIGAVDNQSASVNNRESTIDQSSSVDLTEELIEMKAAKSLFAVNAKTLQTQENMLGRILDIKVWPSRTVFVACSLVPYAYKIAKTNASHSGGDAGDYRIYPTTAGESQSNSKKQTISSMQLITQL